MQTRYVYSLLLLMGFALGWLGKSWLTSDKPATIAAFSKRSEPNGGTNTHPEHTIYTPIADPEHTLQASTGNFPSSALARFEQALKQQHYSEAILIYRQQAQLSQQTLAILKDALLSYLNMLLETHRQNDFSELTGLFLSNFYDDIDILLLLAGFNYGNHAYLEAINVYQIAHTYAYTQADQQTVQKQFIDFANSVDQLYTKAQDWFALSNFYAQIEAAGLITPWQRYRQAIAHLHSGNQTSAVAQLEQLQNHAQVGEQASATLNEIRNRSLEVENIQIDSWQYAQAIPLQKSGDHFLVRLNFNKSDNVTLLIDTGASMTTLTQRAFNTLSSISLATEIGMRIFQTANGPTSGTLYGIPQINIGAHQMHNTQIAVLDFPTPQGVDGLLGMNILGQYRFQIDQENARLLLRKK